MLFSGTKLALSDISSIISEPSGLFLIIKKSMTLSVHFCQYLVEKIPCVSLRKKEGNVF